MQDAFPLGKVFLCSKLSISYHKKIKNRVFCSTDATRTFLFILQPLQNQHEPFCHSYSRYRTNTNLSVIVIAATEPTRTFLSQLQPPQNRHEPFCHSYRRYRTDMNLSVIVIVATEQTRFFLFMLWLLQKKQSYFRYFHKKNRNNKIFWEHENQMKEIK